jgi:hypothetical protein
MLATLHLPFLAGFFMGVNSRPRAVASFAAVSIVALRL